MNVDNGTIINQYKILSEIGKGGMGEVYLAEDTKLDRRVALKILPAEFAKDTDRMSRFVREAKSASALNHPNIITIHEIGESDGTHYIATEFIDGKTLNEYAKDNSLSYKSALEIAIQIASALDEAHQAGIVHRDIKPDNVMIRENGLAKILDFGIAKLSEASPANVSSEDATAIKPQSTTPGTIIGTANYMSPEQAKGQVVDARTDIFSLGVVLYEMIAGHLPFEGKTALEMISSVLKDEPKPLTGSGVHPDMEAIIAKTLKKDRNERYGDTKELLDDLQNLRKRIEFEAELKRTTSPDQVNKEKTQILKAATHENTSATQTISNVNSIAVMPFTSMSSDEDNEYFCDGLAEELLNALSKIEDLKVASRTSAFSFKAKNTNVSEIGEKLSVKNVLEGSVRRSGNKLRISVQLVNAVDGYQIWSESYDREMEDIFDVQDEIALAVVDALKVKLFGDEKAALLKRGTNNPEAYQLYLKGRFYFDKFTMEGFKRSVEYYKQALAIEPNYAPAFAALSKSYNYACYVGFGETAMCLSEAKAAVDKALALDQSLAEAHHAQALIKFNYERDWTRAEKAFRRAIELNYTDHHEHYCMFLAVMERSEEAVAEGKLAIELAPLTLLTIYIAGWGFWAAGRVDLANEQGHKLHEMEPNFSGGHVHLGMSLWDDGSYQKAIDKLETAVKLGAGNDIKMLLGLMYGMEGEREKASQLLTEFIQLDKQGIFTANQQALIYAGLGEMDRAFELLEQAVGRQEGALPFLKQFSSLCPKFHNDPRMTELLHRLGLPTDKTNRTDESLEAKTAMLRAGEATSDNSAKDLEIENAETKSKSESTTNPKSKIRDQKSKWWLLGFLGLIALIGGFFGYRYFTPGSQQINSIAVLPFENNSGNADSDYLSDGLAESLIYRLSQLPNLKVSPTSSVFRYKGKANDPNIVAQELGVDSVLTGRITQRGDNLSISVNLVDTRNGKSLWGEKYERKVSELLATQSDITNEITNKLQLKLSGESEQMLAKKYTDNSEAYQLYLKGRYLWNKRTYDDLIKAIVQFKAAIKKDDNYALAYAGLADTYSIIPFYRGSKSGDYMDQAKIYAERAVELDDRLAETHTSLAFVNEGSWNWSEAEKHYKRAVELNPNYSTAQLRYARFEIRVLGQKAEALKRMKRALELEPASLVTSDNLSQVYLAAGDVDSALEQARRTVELDPRFSFGWIDLTYAQLKKGLNAEAMVSAAKVVEVTKRSSRSLVCLGFTNAVTGQRSQALAIVNELEGRYQNDQADATEVGAVYVGLGDKDQAFNWLNKAVDNHSSLLVDLRAEYPFAALHDDSRFAELLKRMNMPE